MARAFSQSHVWRSPVCFGVEFILIGAAVVLAAVLRFAVGGLGWTQAAAYLPVAFLVAVVCQISMYYAGLYDLSAGLHGRQLFTKLFQALAAATVALTALFYLLPHLIVGRGIFLLSVALAFVFIVIWRLVYQQVQEMNRLKVNLVILGTGTEARHLASELLRKKSLGYEIKGFIDDDPNLLGVSIVNPKVIGSSDQLPEIVLREGINKVVVALSDRRGKLPMDTLLACKLQGIDVEDVASFYERLSGRIMLANLRPSWMIFSDGFMVSPLVWSCKRLVDVGFALLGLMLAAPFMPVIGLLIKLDSPGPMLFTQERVGQDGQLFHLFKFRTMCANAEALTGPVYAGESDPRITRIGRFLRRMRLDEIPQLFNVLRGEMSFVGPRPERAFFVKRFEKEIRYYSQRLSVKPGITGWAQVNYHYGATDEDAAEKLQFDLYYIKNLSLLLDLFIILKTVKIVLLGEGAR